MKKVKFKSIVIYDLTKKRGFTQTFLPGVNVVTSAENHVGKSCLVKSLYYALGADINYDQNWDVRSKTFCLNFSVNDSQYYIIRKNKSFLLLDGDNNASFCTHVSTELNFILKNIFDFGVYLTNKRTKKLELTPPAFTYLPYFIDQDKGWSSEMFSSFENLAQYNAPERRASVLYHYNVRDENFVKTENVLVDEKTKHEAVKRESDLLKKTLLVLEDEAKGINIVANVEELAKVMENSRKQTELLLKQALVSRERIQRLQEVASFYSIRLKQIKSYTRSDSNNDITGIKRCSHCGYIDDESIYDVAHKAFYERNKSYIVKQVQSHLSNLSKEIEKEKNNYDCLQKKLQLNHAELSEQNHGYEAYIKHQGLESSMYNINKKLIQLQSDIERIDKIIKDLEAQKRQIVKRDSDVNKKYIGYAHQFMSQLGVPFEDDTVIDTSSLLKNRSQGAMLPKTIVALHAAILETIRFQNSKIMFPFVVDSPCTMEASDSSRTEILNFLHRLDYLPQVIISTVDYKKYATNKENELNLIELSQPRSLLSGDVYERLKDEITEIENKFQMAKEMYNVIKNKNRKNTKTESEP